MNLHNFGSGYLAERVNLIRYRMIQQHDEMPRAQEFIEQTVAGAGNRKIIKGYALLSEI